MSERLRELLLKAVHSLDPDEQEEVFGHLLVGAGAPPALWLHQPFLALSRPTAPPDRSTLADELSTTLAVASGELKLLPVRLPRVEYERLRSWSREHGFSMAVIVRTLVERFLNGEARAPQPRPPDR
jgi:hypothetical protein